jgi:hypothetical protein
VADSAWQLGLESALFRVRLRWIGAILLIVSLTPRAEAGSSLGFFWQGELGLGTAPTLVFAGLALALLAAAFWRFRPERLAALSLVALAGGYLVLASSTLAAQHAGTSLPSPRVSLGAVAIGLAVAGISVAEPGLHARARGLLVAAAGVALLHYVWSWLSGGPLAELAVLVRALRSSGSVGNRLGACLLLTLALCPSLLVAIAFAHARHRRRGAAASFSALLCFYGTPMILEPLVSRSLARQDGDLSTLAGSTADLISTGAIFVLTASAASFLARFAATPPVRAWATRRIGLACTGLILLSTAPWAFARERRGPWLLGRASAAADRFFGVELTEWNDAGAARVRLSGARFAPTRDPRELSANASAIDRGLGKSVAVLLELSARRELGFAAFARGVSDVNRASRRARLPYYLDPTELLVRGPERWLRIDSYGIERVTRFRSDDHEIDVIVVHSLTPRGAHGDLLGLSRDTESEALVFADATARYARELDEMVLGDPPRCSKARSGDPLLEAALRRCGELLHGDAAAARTSGILLSTVARHELQHQLDRGDPPVARTLARRSRERGLGVPPKINRELSAYLAEFDAAKGSAHVSLARLLRLAVIDHSRVDGAAARIALEVMAGGADGEARTESAFLSLSALDDESLRARAVAAWQAEFGRALAVPVRQ